MDHHYPGATVLAKALVAVAAYLLGNFLLSWILLARRVAVSGPAALFAHADSLLTIVALGVAMATLMFAVIGEWAFINPPMFVALPFLASALVLRFERAPTAALWGATLVVAIGATLLVSATYHDKTGVYLKTSSRLNDLRGGGDVAERYDGQVAALLALRDRNAANAVVFDPEASFPASAAFWSCSQAPLVYPAVTERAWVGDSTPTPRVPITTTSIRGTSRVSRVPSCLR